MPEINNPSQQTAPPAPSPDKSQTFKENEPQDKSTKKLFFLGWIGLGIAVIAVAILLVFFLTQGEEEKTKEVKLEALPTAAVVEEPTLVKSEWSFEVLNGSGVSGAAQKTADKLEDLGYKVVSIDNASTSSYMKNELYVTADMLSKESLLVGDLEAEFNIASISGTFTSSTTASARLIVGKD